MLVGWIVGNFVFVFYWMPNPIAPFRDFSLQSAWILGIFFYFCNISSLLLNAFIYKKIKLKKSELSFNLLVLIAALFTFMDYLIPQFLPVSFPQTLLRAPGSPFWASLGGIPLISFIIYLLFLIIAECKKTKSVLIITSITVVLYMLPSLFQVKPETIKSLKLNLVEPNVPKDIKRMDEKVSLIDLIISGSFV
jgi:apolipoprotein N-acyltransferase